MLTALNLLSALFTVAAAWFLHAGFTMETAVSSPDAPVGFEGVANLQLMHIQAMNLHLGIGAAIVAALLFAAAAILHAMKVRPAA